MTLLEEGEPVTIRFTLSMDYIPVEKNIEMGQLRVDILDAIYADYHVDRDAYCEFYLNEQMVFKTHAVKKSWQPAWNEFFEVEIRSRTDARFRIMEYELDAILGIEKAIRHAVIDLQCLEPCRLQDFTIGTSGSIRLQLLFRPE
jgi:Ca2+-dependent lipid-binding protein